MSAQDDLVKRLRNGDFTCDAQEAAILADAIERLSVEKAALQDDNALTNALNDVLNLAVTDANSRIAALEAELAAIKSGQPVEVAGEQMQLVPVEPSNKMIDVGLFANKTTPTGQLYSAIPAYRAMLTASSAERKQP